MLYTKTKICWKIVRMVVSKIWQVIIFWSEVTLFCSTTADVPLKFWKIGKNSNMTKKVLHVLCVLYFTFFKRFFPWKETKTHNFQGSFHLTQCDSIHFLHSFRLPLCSEEGYVGPSRQKKNPNKDTKKKKKPSVWKLIMF